MNQSKNKMVEKIKSVVLVVLFLLTILLLYFFWEDVEIRDFSLENLRFSTENELRNTVKVTDVILPSYINICFDNDTYTKISNGRKTYWNGETTSVFKAFQEVISSEDTYTEEITAMQYEEIMTFISLRAVFEYSLPFREYCEFLGIDIPPSMDVIASIGEIGFSTGNTESMFLYDEASGKYFRIVSDFSAVSLLEDVSRQAASENLTYYPLEFYVGQDLDNRVLVPAFLETDLAALPAICTFDTETKEKLEASARSFFSGTFDFVRKIEEQSGKTIYMYGYGEKTLVIDIDGSIEYSTENIDGGRSTGGGYFTALEVALLTLSEQRGLVSDEDGDFQPYLVYAEPLAGQAGYRFEFGLSAGGEKIYFESGSPFEIEVSGGQVTYFKSRYLRFDETSVHFQPEEVYTPINVIAMYYEDVYRVLQEAESGGTGRENTADFEDNADKRFDYVSAAVSDVTYGYLFMEEEKELHPCYILFLNSGNLAFYFDLYTTELLEYNNFYEIRRR